MKYDETLRDFLTGYLHQHLRIVSKVGNIYEGYLQSWNEHSIFISSRTSILISLKDILSIEETDIGGKADGIKPFGYVKEESFPSKGPIFDEIATT